MFASENPDVFRSIVAMFALVAEHRRKRKANDCAYEAENSNANDARVNQVWPIPRIFGARHIRLNGGVVAVVESHSVQDSLYDHQNHQANHRCEETVNHPRVSC
jgi:hypothetical protein